MKTRIFVLLCVVIFASALWAQTDEPVSLTAQARTMMANYRPSPEMPVRVPYTDPKTYQAMPYGSEVCLDKDGCLSGPPFGALHFIKTKQPVTADASFWLLEAALMGATIADGYTTFRGIDHGAKEANPIMKPFVKMGKPATYAFLVGTSALYSWRAYSLKKDGNKLWLVMMILPTGLHGACAGLNMRF